MNPAPSKNRIVPYAAVNAAIFNKKNEILITRRSKHIREPGKWCLPGGHFDGGEDWVGALRREVAEETGLTVRAEQLVGIYSNPELTVTEEPIKEGHFGQFLVILFKVTEFEGEVRLTDEVDAWDWFPSSKLPEPMIKSHPIRVEDAYRFKKQVFVR